MPAEPQPLTTASGGNQPAALEHERLVGELFQLVDRDIAQVGSHGAGDEGGVGGNGGSVPREAPPAPHAPMFKATLYA